MLSEDLNPRAILLSEHTPEPFQTKIDVQKPDPSKYYGSYLVAYDVPGGRMYILYSDQMFKEEFSAVFEESQTEMFRIRRKL